MGEPGAQERAAQAVRAILDELAMAGFKWEEYPTLVDAIERHVDQAVAQAVQAAYEDAAQIAEKSVERTRPAMATSALATMRATADGIAATLRARSIEPTGEKG